MDGKSFVKYIETTLIERDISKETFYKESGVTTASMSQWRSGKHDPSSAAVRKVENFFNGVVEKRLPLASDFGNIINVESLNLPDGFGGSDLSENQLSVIDRIINMPPEELAKKMAALEAVLDM